MREILEYRLLGNSIDPGLPSICICYMRSVKALELMHIPPLPVVIIEIMPASWFYILSRTYMTVSFKSYVCRTELECTSYNYDVVKRSDEYKMRLTETR